MRRDRQMEILRFLAGLGLVLTLIAALLAARAWGQTPISRDATLYPGNQMIIRAGSNYPDGDGWKRVHLAVEQVDSLTWKYGRVEHPVTIRPNGIISLCGRSGWEFGGQGEDGWINNLQPVVQSGKWGKNITKDKPVWRDSTTAVWEPAPGESMLVTVFPEGVQIFRVFTDSTRLASYRDTISYRYTKSKIKSQSRTPQALTLETDSGELIAIGSVYAWNSDGDSVYGTIDTARQGGKSIFREVFPPGSLEALAAGGHTVTVDPTITIQPSVLTSNDGFLNHNLGSGQSDSSSIDGYSLLFHGVNPTFWQIRSTIKFLGIPKGRIYRAYLTMYTGFASVGTPQICVKIINGPDASFTHGNDASWGNYPGQPSWKYRRNNDTPYQAGQGLTGNYAIVAPFQFLAALDQVNTFYLSPSAWRIIERHNPLVAFLFHALVESGGSTIVWYAHSSKSATASYRPALTVLYTHAPPPTRYGGGFGRSYR